jgi:hypothetical protein
MRVHDLPGPRKQGRVVAATRRWSRGAERRRRVLAARRVRDLPAPREQCRVVLVSRRWSHVAERCRRVLVARRDWGGAGSRRGRVGWGGASGVAGVGGVVGVGVDLGLAVFVGAARAVGLGEGTGAGLLAATGPPSSARVWLLQRFFFGHVGLQKMMRQMGTGL